MHVICGPEDIAEGLAALAKGDPRLDAVIACAGDVPLRLAEPGYHGLANIIVSQMVSKASAAAIWARLTALAGAPLTASALLIHDEATLRAVGLSGAKIAALRHAAEAEISGLLDPHLICRMEAGDAMRQLTAIRGIGPWTADIYLMFCAGHPDIFPVGDVALQSAVSHAFGHERRLNPRELAVLAAVWRPWRSVAARLFWAYYSQEMHRQTDPLG
jgi:DNA-3-methyladenine glycosylase II